MIPVPTYRDSKVAVFGLGRAGLAAVRALSAGGAEVLVDDDSPARRADGEAAGGIHQDLSHGDWAGVEVLVPSPGVPLTHPAPHPVVGAARAAGVEIHGEVDLLAGALRPQGGATVDGPRLVGLTGTNGKSTTTALLGHLLSDAGLDVAMGGNLGTAALALDPLPDSGIYVLEMSSYQLDLTSRAVFDVAALLNITPDHLDRHGGMDGYVAAKKRIFAGQTATCTAVIAIDDRITAGIFDGLAAAGPQRMIPVSTHRRLDDGIFVEGDILYDALDSAPRKIATLSGIAVLLGEHNRQNAAVAYAVARALGVEERRAAHGLASYPGLPHRMEPLGTIDGVHFVNDSKATNVSAAIQALGCYDPIYWIAGGRAKDDDLAPLLPFRDRIRHAFLIGEAAGDFADALSGRMPVTISRTLDVAVPAAAAMARASAESNPVVLLSPACASFDQFDDFESRGDCFRALFDGLKFIGLKGEADE
jgi:UDP-N-acetylmuramoylalanine--D-glutamate ligase